MNQLSALNTISTGWTESTLGGLLCSADISGGIIDSEIVSGEWFVIFNDAREMQEGFDTRGDAIEAFFNA